MRRANPKKNKNPKVTMTNSQIEKLKIDVTREATDKASLLVLLATADELGLTEEQISKIAIRVDRYAGYVNSKLVALRDLQKSIEKHTGIKFISW